MSYAETPPHSPGNTHTSARGTTSRTRASSVEDEIELDDAPEGEPFDEPTDWGRVGSFGAGILVGALLGAGAALLLAPQSGEETRDIIVRRTRDFTRRTRDLRDRAGDSWSNLGFELRRAARHGRRRVSRGLTRARWTAADTFDD